MEFCILHNLHNGFQPLPKRRVIMLTAQEVEDSLNDESFTAYFPFYPDTQTFTKTFLCPSCRYNADRDISAASNILLRMQMWWSSGSVDTIHCCCVNMLSCASSTRLGKTFTRHFATYRWDQSTHWTDVEMAHCCVKRFRLSWWRSVTQRLHKSATDSV